MIDLRPLDLLVAAAALVVAVWFLVAWRRIGEPPFLLFAIGLALKAVGYAMGGPSEFGNLHGQPSTFQVVQLAALFAGNLIMVSAYLGGQRRRGWSMVGWALAAGAVLLAILDVVVPPLGQVDLDILLPTVHAAMALANVSCAIFAFQGFRASPHAGRALVPAAFLFWGISNYTWLMIDFGAPAWLGAFVQAWRVLAVALMLGALIVPRRALEQEDAHGPA